MQVESRRWTSGAGWQVLGTPLARVPQLVLAFGERAVWAGGRAVEELRAAYPGVPLFGCSTAGEIAHDEVTEGTMVAVAVAFAHTTVRMGRTRLSHAGESRAAGVELARQLPPQGLTHVLVLANGITINGSDLAEALSSNLPPGVAVTGGLAGDGVRFEQTLVCVGEEVASDTVGVVGLYGDRLKVGYGSLGGWDPFGPERLITRSNGNILYELDGEPALALYKRYLGDHAAQLPSSGLRFPLSVRSNDPAHRVVRTILGVDETTNSLTFAGDVPEGHFARLMTANIDRLIDGATGAATSSLAPEAEAPPALALLISCVGRRLVLGQRVEEEVENVRLVVGPSAVLCGFYSYGEIAPFAMHGRCELHNQTMTITTFSES
ncbi:MAG: FIST N-terminal domain-containing protein [Gemmatimonadales bacterium]